MKKLLLLALMAIVLCGCSPVEEEAPAPTGTDTAAKKITLVFQTPLAEDLSHPVHKSLALALEAYSKEHSNIKIALVEPAPIDTNNPPDLASIKTGELSDSVNQGGVEPLAARIDSEWLENFSPESVDRCKDAGVLFALPWLEADNPEESLVLISFALSLHKPEAVELMKFLATDEKTQEEIAAAMGLKPARVISK